MGIGLLTRALVISTMMGGIRVITFTSIIQLTGALLTIVIVAHFLADKTKGFAHSFRQIASEK